MKLTRRKLLMGAGATALISPFTMAGVTTFAKDLSIVRLAIYDSRLNLAQEFAHRASRQGIQVLDIADQDNQLWREMRYEATIPGDVIGMTKWADWVQIRSLLQEYGKRTQSESQIDGTYHQTLFQWSMRQVNNV